MNPKELRAKRAQVWGQMCAIMDEAREAGRDLEAEEARQYDELEGELSGLTKQIERAERHAQIDSQLEEIREEPVFAQDPTTGEVRETRGQAVAEAFDAFVRHGIGSLTPEQRQLMEARWVAHDGESRAQAVGTDAAGGYTVPEGFWDRISETMLAFGGMLEVANVIDTSTGATLPWPTNDDTGNEGAILAENTQVTEQDVTFGQRSLGAYVYTSKLIRVSYQFLQDTSIDTEGFLSRKFAERLGRIQNKHFTIGTGTSQPDGIQPDLTVGKTGATGQTTSVTYDDLVDLVHSVDVAYRSTGRARFMLHDLTVAKLRKLKDNDGRPIWQPGLLVGQPDQLLGHPVGINNHWPEMAASAKSIGFGDFNLGYVVRRVRGVQVLRLTERYADFLQVGFLAFNRVDGAPDDPNAVKAYQNSAT